MGEQEGVGDDEHQHDRHLGRIDQDPGHFPDLDVAIHEQGDQAGIDHHHDGRRDQDAERAGVTDQAGGEGLRIALLDHARDHDRTDRDHRGRRRTGDGREQHAGQDRGHAQAAAQPAYRVDGEADHALGHAAGCQKRRRQDEERNRHQRRVMHGVEHLVGQRTERVVGKHQDRQHAGQAQRDGDRNPHQHEGEQQNEQQGSAHDFGPFGVDAD